MTEPDVHRRPPPAAPARPRPRWGCGDIAYGILLAYAVSFVFLIALALAGIPEGSLAYTVFGALSVWIGLGGWALFCSWVKGLGRLELDFGWAFRWFDVFVGLGLALTMLLAGFGLAVAQQLIGVEEVGNAQFLENQQASGPGWTYLGLTLMVAIGAPIVEELFFRGLAFAALARRFGPGIAVAGSSLIFGSLHLQPGPLVPVLFLVTNLIMVGLVLGLSRWYFKRTGPAVFAHVFFNLTAALAILAGATG
ncbi:MAG: CPBP family intramembrane metalloprotease [Actinobacteria bacterium]|nr:CPBP family intramembrane metalloprotease [Actinomycetota bacterium]